MKILKVAGPTERDKGFHLKQTNFTITPRAPFRLDFTVWVLRRRAHNNIDRWDGQAYTRVLTLHGEPVAVSVTQTTLHGCPILMVESRSSQTIKNLAGNLENVLNRVLGIERDLAEFYSFSSTDNILGPLVRRFLGLKPPMFPTVFEALVNGIACQQITLTLGIHLLNRLTAKYGVAFEGEQTMASAFPRPEDLARLGSEALRPLGFSRQKSQHIVELSKIVATGGFDLEALKNLKDEQAIEALEEIPGVGQWTADYVLLRGLGRLNVFPRGDVGARHRLEKWLVSNEEIEQENLLQSA